MKKYLYLAIAAFAFVACSVEEFTPENDSPEAVPMKEVSIKAVFDEGNATTKADFDNAGACAWEAGDAIAVHTKNGALATLTTSSAGTSVTFTGSIPVGDEILEDAVAYYPATIAVTGYPAKVNLPTSYASAAAAKKGFLLRGVLSSGEITFKHIGGLVKMTVNDIPTNVNKLVFSTGVAITGQLDVNTGGSNAVCEIGSGATSVTIATSAGERSSSSVFFLPVPAGTLTGGFSIILKEDDTAVSTKTTTKDIAIGRAKVVNMKAYTPEGTDSDWYVTGGFNSWSTTANRMTNVLGHDGWVVARGITVDSEGFKLFKSGSWKGTNGANLHTQYYGNDDGSSDNIKPSADKAYDIYFNPSDNKYFIANAGETWIYKTVHLMCDMELSDATYYLHVWPHAGSGLNTTWPGIEGSAETISGIPYHKFDIAICDGDFTSNTYDCIFHNSDDSIRYDFRDGVLTPDTTHSDYYLSFTGKEYNKGVDGTTYGDSKTNPMTQFDDPAKPEGDSYWGVFVGGSLARMHWDNSKELVYKGYSLGPDTEIKLNFNYKWIFFGPSTATVSTDTAFDVSRSNTDTFKVPSLDDTYLCDIYLNIFDKTARIVPQSKENASVTLYFGLPNPGSWVRYYTFNGRSMEWSVGIDEEGSGKMTEYETLNGVKYYKAVLPGKEFWNTSVSLIIRSDGIEYSQTNDFVTADWSGYKSEYWFSISGRTISQLRGRPVFPSTIDGKFADWLDLAGEEYTSGTTKHKTLMKAYSDGDNLWVYLKLTPGTGSYTADGWRYFRLYFDRDNRSDTGFNTSHWFYPGADEIATGVNNILVYYGKDGFGNAEVRNLADDGTLSGAGIKSVNNGASGIEVELKMPLSSIGSITGNIINIYAVGSCGSEFDGKITGVYVPSK